MKYLIQQLSAVLVLTGLDDLSFDPMQGQEEGMNSLAPQLL